MKFGYTILYVRDVERIVKFYEEAFGIGKKIVHEGGYAELETGETTLAFLSVEVVKAAGIPFIEPSTDGPAQAVEIAFVTDDVAADFQRAVDAGAVAVLEPMDKPWGQTVSYVRDIEGFIVEICSPVVQ